MKYLPAITKAQYLRDYVISIKFDDGVEKSIDISQYFKGPVFEALKRKSEFKKFFLDAGALAWPCGIDLAPDALYLAEDLEEQSVA